MKLKNKYKINEYTFPDYFIEFLKSQGVLDQYMNNFDIDFGFFESGMYDKDLIDYAFDWERAKEDYNFWVDISDKWDSFRK